MRRGLFERILVRPYTSGALIDRMGILSAVLGVDCTDVTGTDEFAVAVTHCDTANGTFEPVNDPRLFVDADIPLPIKAPGLYQITIDLVGCKQFIKINLTTGATTECTYAIALGDTDEEPLT